MQFIRFRFLNNEKAFECVQYLIAKKILVFRDSAAAQFVTEAVIA